MEGSHHERKDRDDPKSLCNSRRLEQADHGYDTLRKRYEKTEKKM